MPVRVQTIEKGSVAERLGIQPGTTLLSVDGNELNDMLDYQFYTASPKFTLAASMGGKLEYLQVDKGEYEPLGCEFSTYLIDEKHSCANHCMFCFIDQLPKGLRETLYFKDDDERLSFLFGNYITLTNLSQHEVDRIKRMHISPINVSVHTTNPQLRVRMMANKRAGETLKYLQEFADAGITLNCQLVLCRGINDGDELRRTLTDLTNMHPAVQSIAAVPAGLTDYRQGLYPLTVYDKESSAATLKILEEFGNRCKQQYGRRMIFPGDEWYLTAGIPIPPAAFYEDYAQLENGVGMWRLFHDQFLAELECGHRGPFLPKKVDMVTGTLVAPLIRQMADAMQKKYRTMSIRVHAIQNNFFGGNVSVTGLVTATDIIAQCKGKLHSRTLAVPDSMLRAEGDMFLDDITLPQLERALGVKVKVIPSHGDDCVRALLGVK